MDKIKLEQFIDSNYLKYDNLKDEHKKSIVKTILEEDSNLMIKLVKKDKRFLKYFMSENEMIKDIDFYSIDDKDYVTFNNTKNKMFKVVNEKYIVTDNIENILYLPGYIRNIYMNLYIESLNNINDFELFLKRLNFKNLNVFFDYGYNFTNTCKKVNEFDNKNKFGLYDDQFNITKFNEVIEIDNTLEFMIKDIKDSDLSPYERFIAVYNIVKSFKNYKIEEKNMDPNTSRSLLKILNNDYMVCVGYSLLLKDLLKRVGIDSCEYGIQNISTKNGNISHSRVMVNLIDYKYNIDGYFVSDPTLDSSHNNKGYFINKNMILSIHDEREFNLESKFFDDALSSDNNLKNILDKTSIYRYYFSSLDPKAYECLLNNTFDLLLDRIQYKSIEHIDDNKTKKANSNVKKFINKDNFTIKELVKYKIKTKFK